MKSRLFMSMVLIGLAALTLSCASVSDSISQNPMAALQSAARIGEAAVKASQEITQEQEIYLGRSVSARLLAKYPLYNNAQLYKYINLVGAGVAMVSDRPDLPFHFAVLDTDEVNAFAAPGGYVFITRGMLKSVKDEEELAAILGHEIGHVCARHSLKSIKGELWKQVAVITAQEGAKHGGVDPKLLDLFGQATDGVLDTLMNVGYTQPMEYEADRLGQTYATTAGYDPGALRRFASYMQQREQGQDKSLNAWLGTHPTFTARLKQLPAPEKRVLTPETIKLRTNRFRTTARR